VLSLYVISGELNNKLLAVICYVMNTVQQVISSFMPSYEMSV